MIVRDWFLATLFFTLRTLPNLQQKLNNQLIINTCKKYVSNNVLIELAPITLSGRLKGNERALPHAKPQAISIITRVSITSVSLG